MNITCTVEKIRQALTLADRMAGKQLTLPTLHGLYCLASGSSLKIRATNLAVGIEIEIPVNITSEGSCIIKGDVVLNVLQNLPQQDLITISIEHENILIQSKKTQTVIKALPQEDFPELPVLEGDVVTIKRDVIQELIKSVAFAAAVSEIKPEIASVFLYAEQETLFAVATDSFRLAEKRIKIKQFPDITKILIPYKNITELLRVLEVSGDTIHVSYTRNQLSLRSGGIYFTTRLIDGGFPAYQMILPKEEHTKVVIMKQDLQNILKLSSVFADKFFQIGVSVQKEKKQLIITSKNADIGSTEAAIDAVIDGESIEVVCNLKYILDVFQTLSGDSISLSFTQPTKPIMVRSVQDTSFLYLLMPTNR